MDRLGIEEDFGYQLWWPRLLQEPAGTTDRADVAMRGNDGKPGQRLISICIRTAVVPVAEQGTR